MERLARTPPGRTGKTLSSSPNQTGRGKVFAWKLTETLDPFNNRIAYDYERDTGQEGPHHWDQLYLKRVRYVDFEDEATGDEHFLASVTFVYEDRPDPFSEYRSGFEIRTRLRCKRIVVQTHADPTQPTLVRTYELVYLDERVAGGELPASVLPLNSVSLLSQVRVVGHDESQPEPEDQVEALPPLEFGYTRFEPEGRDFFPLEGNLPARSVASPDIELADVFGNGLPDLIQLNGTARYWRNLGGGRFDLPRPMKDAPAGLGLADPGSNLSTPTAMGGLISLSPLTVSQVTSRSSMTARGIAARSGATGKRPRSVCRTPRSSSSTSTATASPTPSAPAAGWSASSTTPRKDGIARARYRAGTSTSSRT